MNATAVEGAVRLPSLAWKSKTQSVPTSSAATVMLLEDVGLDEVAVGVIDVVVVAEDDQLLDALLVAALAEGDLAEAGAVVGGGEGAVAVEVGARRCR